MSQARGVEVLLRATRALLRAGSVSDVESIAVEAIGALGAKFAPEAFAEGEVLTLDVSYGLGERRTVYLPRATLSGALLERHLFAFVADVGWALKLAAQADGSASAEPISEPWPDPAPVFVAFSELDVAAGGVDGLEAAFRDRLGAVDGWPGFRSLQVWSDIQGLGGYVMVSWWESAEAFAAYMGSEVHRRSHKRIPTGVDRPRARQFRRFQVIAR